MPVEKRNPPEVTKPIGHYSHVAIVPPDHRLLFLAGQVGADADASYPESLETQFENALRAALTVAGSQGAGPDDVVKINYFLTERPADFQLIRAMICKAFPGVPPAATFLIVSGLATPQIKVEIELIVAVKA